MVSIASFVFSDAPVAALASIRPPLRRARPDGAIDPIRLLESDLRDLAEDHGLYSGVYVHVGHALLATRSGQLSPLRVVASSAVTQRLFFEESAIVELAFRASTAHRPFAWSTGGSEAARGADPGRAGVVAPVQDHAAGPGMVVLIGTDLARAHAIVSDAGLALASAATDIHLRALALLRREPTKTPTPREIECLRLAALGMTAPDTARILGIKSRTVAFHLENVAAKLGAINKVHAVAIGISEGLLRL